MSFELRGESGSLKPCVLAAVPKALSVCTSVPEVTYDFILWSKHVTDLLPHH